MANIRRNDNVLVLSGKDRGKTGQVRSVLVVASTATVGVGLVIGAGIGVVLASIAWRLTAHAAYVAGDLEVSIPQLAVLVVGALAVGVLVALVPAWRVTRRPERPSGCR